MKVIQPGRKQRGWSKEFKCTGRGNGGGGCGAILLISEYDLYETVDSHQGDNDYFVTFCCSTCGVETDVEVDIIPNGERPSEAERRKIALKNV